MNKNDRMRAAKLDRLQQAIRVGLESGPATAWDMEEVEREGRKKLAARTKKTGA